LSRDTAGPVELTAFARISMRAWRQLDGATAWSSRCGRLQPPAVTLRSRGAHGWLQCRIETVHRGLRV